MTEIALKFRGMPNLQRRMRPVALAVFCAFGLAACAETEFLIHTAKQVNGKSGSDTKLGRFRAVANFDGNQSVALQPFTHRGSSGRIIVDEQNAWFLFGAHKADVSHSVGASRNEGEGASILTSVPAAEYLKMT